MPNERPHDQTPDRRDIEAGTKKIDQPARVIRWLDGAAEFAQQLEHPWVVVGFLDALVSQSLMGYGQSFFKCH